MPDAQVARRRVDARTDDDAQGRRGDAGAGLQRIGVAGKEIAELGVVEIVAWQQDIAYVAHGVTIIHRRTRGHRKRRDAAADARRGRYGLAQHDRRPVRDHVDGGRRHGSDPPVPAGKRRPGGRVRRGHSGRGHDRCTHVERGDAAAGRQIVEETLHELAQLAVAQSVGGQRDVARIACGVAIVDRPTFPHGDVVRRRADCWTLCPPSWSAPGSAGGESPTRSPRPMR